MAKEVPSADDDGGDGEDGPEYKCKDCGTAIQEGYEYCPSCGEKKKWDDV